jgi:hypothetical protein
MKLDTLNKWLLLGSGTGSVFVFWTVALRGGSPWVLLVVGGFALVCFGRLSAKEWLIALKGNQGTRKAR